MSTRPLPNGRSHGLSYQPALDGIRSLAVMAALAYHADLNDAAGEVARIMPELRRLFPDIPTPLELPPEQERRYLFNSVREFIERAGRGRPCPREYPG